MYHTWIVGIWVLVGYTPENERMSNLKIGHANRKQSYNRLPVPSISRYELLVSGRVNYLTAPENGQKEKEKHRFRGSSH